MRRGGDRRGLSRGDCIADELRPDEALRVEQAEQRATLLITSVARVPQTHSGQRGWASASTRSRLGGIYLSFLVKPSTLSLIIFGKGF